MEKLKESIGYLLCGISIAIPVTLLHFYAFASGKNFIITIGIICFMSYMTGMYLATINTEIKIRELKALQEIENKYKEE